MEYPNVKTCLDTSEDNLVSDLYQPCLHWAERFDRGVGYFTTGWINYNVTGLSDFASRGGKMRLITSPILSDSDIDVIINSDKNDANAYAKFKQALVENVESLENEMRADVLNAFSWMLYDGIIEMKFAIPCKKLEEGDFHDKFGVFYREDDALSFSGSINDSKHGFQNYESIKVFKTWSGTKEYVDTDIARFEKIWNEHDKNLRIYTVPSAIKQQIFELRSGNRPYKKDFIKENKWIHQDNAVECFMEKEHGILAMATGTGKTVTAIKIINRLFEERKIKRVVITMYGNDLLDQWAKKIRQEYDSKQIYYHYDSQKQMQNFIMHHNDSILLISRDSNNLLNLFRLFEHAPDEFKSDTLFIFDEVHGAGSSTLVENLNGKLSAYKYRLGLSATPEREYDDVGNEFLLNEVGEVIFEFSLEDAIRKGILCRFNYITLSYELNEEEKQKKKNIIAAFNSKKKNKEPYNENDMFTQLSLVNKLAVDKIDKFEAYISHRREQLKKCIIFVQSKEYGLKLQEVLIKFTDKYHTYYADDEKVNLVKFSEGKLDCLLTCKKISEGIDISSVTNIFLFSSDRSKLVTIQRIGRALRLDEKNPDKVANVIDFILDDAEEDSDNADQERKDFLEKLSKVRRGANEK